MAHPVIAAVDWSGALAGVRRKLWTAEVRGGALVRLECGRNREEAVSHLVDLSRSEPLLVVGLDFAFSFPAWFLRERAIESATEAWALATREGERWLAECPPPFWGRGGRGRPTADPGRGPFRRTESERVPVRGVGPKSVFQIGGAGAVGTGSLRGMPKLPELRRAGFSIWPFDPPRAPLVVEIYPRWLTGGVRKSSRIARALHLAARFGGEDRSLLELASSSEDAFDAAVSALRMAQHARSLLALPQGRGDVEALEGRIWSPVEDR